MCVYTFYSERERLHTACMPLYAILVYKYVCAFALVVYHMERIYGRDVYYSLFFPLTDIFMLKIKLRPAGACGGCRGGGHAHDSRITQPD